MNPHQIIPGCYFGTRRKSRLNDLVQAGKDGRCRITGYTDGSQTEALLTNIRTHEQFVRLVEDCDLLHRKRYVRKTADEWTIQGRYEGHGWEDVCSEETRQDAKDRLREYRENEPQYRHRMVKRRVKITPATATV